MLKPISEELANSLYDILVNVCRASDQLRDQFINWATNTDHGREYRFGGMFGMAGKIWLEYKGVRISGPNPDEANASSELEEAEKEANRQVTFLTTGYQVDRGSWKIDRFLPRLSMRLTGESEYEFMKDEFVFYLGGGFWRAIPVTADGSFSHLSAVRLANPDKTAEEIAIVTRAMNILV